MEYRQLKRKTEEQQKGYNDSLTEWPTERQTERKKERKKEGWAK